MIGGFILGLISKRVQYRLGSVIRPKPASSSSPVKGDHFSWPLLRPDFSEPSSFFMSVRLLPLHWRVVPGLTFRQLCRFSISDTVDLLTAFKNRTGFGFP